MLAWLQGWGPRPKCTGEEIALHMMEEHVQDIYNTEASEPDNEWFESVPVHKDDEDVDTWFGMAVQASCCPCLRLVSCCRLFCAGGCFMQHGNRNIKVHPVCLQDMDIMIL